MKNFKSFLNYYDRNATRVHLIFANMLLVFFAIVFFNTGLLPLASLFDFGILFLLGLILALYRPTWSFAFFIGSLALENISLAPAQFGIDLRPYQFFFIVTAIGVLVHILKKKSPFVLPRLRWFDWALFLFAIAGFISAIGALQKGIALKQAVVVLTYVAIYALVRIFIQSIEDTKRIVPFFLSSAVVVIVYSVWQNLRFLGGAEHFEVMPGRPNGTFAEADWLGMYLVFLISIVLVIIYGQYKKIRIYNFHPPAGGPIFNKFSITKFLNSQNGSLVAGYGLLVASFVALILTVARSAWLGAGVVSFVFLGVFLIKKDWRGAWFGALGIFVSSILASVIVFGVGLTNFQLFNRVQSTGTGLQEITISCKNDVTPSVPIKETITVKDVKELEQYQCRHINLEEIDAEVAAGNFVTTAYREDPNINIRRDIYQKSLEQIRKHPLLGIGWGNISAILGNDERGAGLNASNIFLEIWLGSGIVGLIAIACVLGWVVFVSAKHIIGAAAQSPGDLFVLLGFFAILIPNLFNSGILLAYFWVYLAIALGMLSKE